METPQVHCPKCGSTQIQANKKGFSGKNAVVGGLLTGGIGFLAGTIGSNKVVITCLNCGNRFSPGQTSENSKSFGGRSVKIASKAEFKVARVMSIIMAVISGIITIGTMIAYSYSKSDDGTGWVLISFILFTLFFIYLAKRNKHNIDLKEQEYLANIIAKENTPPISRATKIILLILLLIIVTVIIISNHVNK